VEAAVKTLILEKPGELRLTETAAPAAPGEGEALVRVHRVGVCGTDIHAYRGKQPFFSYPRILGHELGVEVIAVGMGVTHVRVGDKCAVEPYINCQTCIACRQGKGNCCTNMRVLGVHIDGGMREQFVLPARKLHVANALTYEQIALVETLGIGAHAVARAQLRAEENVLVIGAGPIGLSVLQFVAAAGCRAMVLDVSETRLAFCREQLKIADTIHGPSVDVAAVLAELTHGDMPTAVFDATGNAQSMMGALKFLAHGGRLVYVGLFPGDFTLNDPEFHKRETTLLGSRNALPEDFARLIELIEQGVVDTRPWITHRAPVDSVAGEFPKWVLPETGVLKAVIEI
jgi:2-desacetyl-2-hydroxyethyl bacteriochlorophyllide A dehydrogenase